MPWPEVETARKDNRHELVLSGSPISKRLSKDGLDLTIFNLANLNYLNVHETILDDIPDDIERLVNLQTLVLHSNKITRVTSRIGSLTKLKLLDLSRNALELVPEQISNLSQLITLNLAHNRLESLPSLAKNTRLAVLDVSNNKLEQFPDVFHSDTSNLAELLLGHNEIQTMSSKIGTLTILKILRLNGNKMKGVPGELHDCSKLKELDLTDNPITDKRLQKLIAQCHTKQVMDYIKQHCRRETVPQDKTSKKGKKQSRRADSADSNVGDEEDAAEPLHVIKVNRFTNDSLKIVIKDVVKEVRPHLVACLVLNLSFDEETFKQFIKLQTKLHDTVCDKRNAATIATHDLKKLGGGDPVYAALPPNELVIKPLNGTRSMSGAQLFAKLQTEADNLRKEKKRNTYSGIHKYLYLLEGRAKYPCLLNAAQEVVSFPPITNSDLTKISLDTQAILVEVTSAVSLHVCKKVADTLLKEMVAFCGNTLVVQQVRNVDVDGNLKSVYPSRTDLQFEDSTAVTVERE